MKRSKIFLAGTTCLLAIAGVAATKAHKVGTRFVYYTSTNGLCTASKFTHCSINAVGNPCRTGTTNLTKTLYTKSSSATACKNVTGNHATKFNSD